MKKLSLRLFGEQVWVHLRNLCISLTVVSFLHGVADAQTSLKTVEFTDPSASAPNLRVDFPLPELDRVTSVEVSDAGTPLDADKVKSISPEKAQGYHCSVLLLVDKNLGNAKTKARLEKSVTDALRSLTSVSETAPYQIGVALMDGGNTQLLAPLGIKKSILDNAINKFIVLGGTSPEFYAGIKHGIEALAGTPADRKYLILLSSGISNDKFVAQADVIQAANREHVHICTIAYPESADAKDNVQRLAPLADETGGYSLRADTAEFRLPPQSEANLMKLLVSGARVEVNLEGLGATPDLSFKVHSEFGKLYTFAHKTTNIAKAEIPAKAAPQSSPAESAETPHVAGATADAGTPSHSQVESFQDKIKKHLPLAIGLGIIGLIVLAAIGYFVSRAISPAGPPPVVEEPVYETSTGPVEPTLVATEPFAPIESEAPALAWLVTLDSQIKYPINKSAVRIGRKPDNDIVMVNDSVSSHHAEILKRGEKFIIADLDSSNRLVVGGKFVDKTPLEDGDIIELGEVRLRFNLATAEA